MHHWGLSSAFRSLLDRSFLSAPLRGDHYLLLFFLERSWAGMSFYPRPGSSCGVAGWGQNVPHDAASPPQHASPACLLSTEPAGEQEQCLEPFTSYSKTHGSPSSICLLVALAESQWLLLSSCWGCVGLVHNDKWMLLTRRINWWFCEQYQNLSEALKEMLMRSGKLLIWSFWV